MNANIGSAVLKKQNKKTNLYETAAGGASAYSIYMKKYLH